MAASPRSKILMGAAVLLVIGGIFWFRARSKAAASASTAAAAASAGRVVPANVAEVRQEDVPIYLDGIGNVTALMTVTVKPQVDGRLDKVLYREGQAVQRGDLLAQIDPRPFQSQLHQAQGAVARDAAQLKEAEANLARYLDLAQRKLIASQQADDQRALVGQYEGTVQVDQAQVENAKLQLDYTHIASPMDGVTGIRLVDPGNIVHASDQTGIVVLTQLDPIAVVFTLPEDDLPSVSTEMKQGPVTVEVFGRDGVHRLGSGEVSVIDNQINTSTATMRLKATLANSDHMMWPNQFVKVRLHLTTRKAALVVAATAVQRGPQGTFVYTVNPDDTVAVKPVELDVVTGDQAVIGKGLQSKERVVTDGQNQLKPGAKISPRNPTAKSK